ncbi:unnamed protein product [Brassicogethes aeneus]|uniref:C2H2-type domain-containing protein n=1 Tax=Brassicogethes aeneus TaxID=1431903 RepID=A0A9P0FEG1_BRAAE|nr:unnamed protein product [Brassicogethes aeneus]
MEQIVVKNEPEELVNNYDKTSNQDMPSTSGVAIKQEIKEEFNYSDNSRVHIELGVKEESDEDNFDGAKLKFEAKDEVLIDKGYIINLPQRYLNIPAHNFGFKVNDSDQESDNFDHGDKSEDLPGNIKEEERDSDFSEEDDKNSAHNEEKDEDEAMFETKMEVEYHGVQYDESGTDSEVANKEEKEIGKNSDPRCAYECKQCSVIFFKKELLESHSLKCLTPVVVVDKEKMFKCYICEKKFQTKKGLLNHKKFIHNKEKQEQFKCEKCEYQSLREGNLKVHLKIHDRSRYLKCKFCPYLTAALKTLNAHILSKHKLENKGENEIKITSKIHQCAKCSYSTVRKNDYDNHVKVCLKLKNINWFKCHQCPYKTIQKVNKDFGNRDAK